MTSDDPPQAESAFLSLGFPWSSTVSVGEQESRLLEVTESVSTSQEEGGAVVAGIAEVIDFRGLELAFCFKHASSEH